MILDRLAGIFVAKERNALAYHFLRDSKRALSSGETRKESRHLEMALFCVHGERLSP